MTRYLVGAVFVSIAVLGIAGAADACYYKDGMSTPGGCYTVQAEVCSYNADGTGGLYYTGRSRVKVNKIAIECS
jgi:hypothetical protein